MNILVTGARGMVGTALCNNLKNIRDGKNKTRPALHIEEIYEYDLNSTPAELDEYCRKADFVFNLAGVNRPENPEDFMKGNFGFASDLLNCLKKHNNKATIMLSSSIQATLAGRFGNSEYGRSKKAGEELFFQYAQETGAKVAVYRFVNLMGHSRPKYNSAVSTFCWAVANDEPFTVNDRSTELELLYIDDLVEGMFDLLEGKEQHCEFDGVETVLRGGGYKVKQLERQDGDTFRRTIEGFVYPETSRALVIALDPEALLETAQILEDSSVYQEHVEGLYGRGTTTQILNYLDRGIISGLCVTDDFSIGYLSIKRAVEILSNQKLEEETVLDSYYIRKDDLRSPEFEKMLYPIE